MFKRGWMLEELEILIRVSNQSMKVWECRKNG